MELGLRGSPLVQEIASRALGDWASIMISLFLFFFAFTSLLGEYAISEGNIRFVKDDRRAILALRIVVIMAAFGSSLIDVSLMDLIADSFNAVLAIVNVAVLVLLSRTVMKAYRDYREQKKEAWRNPSSANRPSPIPQA